MGKQIQTNWVGRLRGVLGTDSLARQPFGKRIASVIGLSEQGFKCNLTVIMIGIFLIPSFLPAITTGQFGEHGVASGHQTTYPTEQEIYHRISDNSPNPMWYYEMGLKFVTHDYEVIDGSTQPIAVSVISRSFAFNFYLDLPGTLYDQWVEVELYNPLGVTGVPVSDLGVGTVNLNFIGTIYSEAKVIDGNGSLSNHKFQWSASGTRTTILTPGTNRHGDTIVAHMDFFYESSFSITFEPNEYARRWMGWETQPLYPMERGQSITIDQVNLNKPIFSTSTIKIPLPEKPGDPSSEPSGTPTDGIKESIDSAIQEIRPYTKSLSRKIYRATSPVSDAITPYSGPAIGKCEEVAEPAVDKASPVTEPLTATLSPHIQPVASEVNGIEELPMIYRDKFTTLVFISFIFMFARRGIHKRTIRKKTHTNPGKDENSIKKAAPEKQKTPAGTSDSPAASNSFLQEKPISVCQDPLPLTVPSMADKTSNNCESWIKETANYSTPWENPLPHLESAMGNKTCGICGIVNVEIARFCKDCGNPLLTTHSPGKASTSEPVREFNLSDPISPNSNDIPDFSLVHGEVEPPFPISRTGHHDNFTGLTSPFSLIPDPGFPTSNSGPPILPGLQQPFQSTYIPSQPSFHGLYISRHVDTCHPYKRR